MAGRDFQMCGATDKKARHQTWHLHVHHKVNGWPVGFFFPSEYIFHSRSFAQMNKKQDAFNTTILSLFFLGFLPNFLYFHLYCSPPVSVLCEQSITIQFPWLLISLSVLWHFQFNISTKVNFYFTINFARKNITNAWFQHDALQRFLYFLSHLIRTLKSLATSGTCRAQVPFLETGAPSPD